MQKRWPDAVLELKKKMGLRCDLKDLELDDDQIAGGSHP